MVILCIGIIAVKSQTDPTPAISEIRDYQNGSGNITVIGILEKYGTSDEPKWMEATIRAQDNSWTKTVSNPANKNGKIIKGNTYTLPTVTVPKSGNYVVNVGVGGCFGWKTVYGQSRTIPVNVNTAVSQTKQTLTKPQWVQKLPSNVIANTDYTVSWIQVANAQKYRIYFTQNGKDVGWDYLPTGTSQIVKIPNITGTVYIGLIAMPSDYNKYNQSNELNMSFNVSMPPNPRDPPKPTPRIDLFEPINGSEFFINENVNFKISATNTSLVKIFIRSENSSKADELVKAVGNKGNKTVSMSNYAPGTYKITFKALLNDYTDEGGDLKTIEIKLKPIVSINSYAPADGKQFNLNDNIEFKVSANNSAKRVKIFIREVNAPANDFKTLLDINGYSGTVKIKMSDYKPGTYRITFKALLDDWTEGDSKSVDIKLVSDNKIVEYLQIPQNGGLLKKVGSGKIQSVYIPVSTLKKISNDIRASKITLPDNIFHPDGLDDDALQEFITGATTTAVYIGLINPAVGITIETVVIGYIFVCAAYDAGKPIEEWLINQTGIATAKIIRNLVNSHASGYIIFYVENPPSSGPVSYTNEKQITSVITDYMWVPLDGMISSDAQKISNIFNRYNISNVQGNIKTQGDSKTLILPTQPQTYNVSNFVKIGNAKQYNFSGHNYIGEINSTNGFRVSINSNSTRTATFSIVYRSDNRGGKLTANGVTQYISFPSTNWNWGTKEVQAQLRQGANTIEFYGGYPNSSSYAPDIAEITIK